MKLKLRSWGLLGVVVLVGSAGCGHTTNHIVGEVAGGSDIGIPNGGSGGDGSESGGRAGWHSCPLGACGGGSGLSQGADGGTGDQLVTSLDCAGCEKLVAGHEIAGIAATDTDLYWVEHGSYDKLDNYQNDGRLLTAPIAGGASMVLAEGLEGPVEVALTPHYIYMLLGESSAADGQSELVRFSRDGHTLEHVQAGVALFNGGLFEASSFGNWLASQFAGSESSAVWVNDKTVYRVTETPGAEPQALFEVDPPLLEVLGDESFAYVLDRYGISTLPWTGGERTPLQAFDNTGNQFSHLSVAGDAIYAVEDEYQPTDAGNDLFYVSRMPKAGGSWKRVAALESRAERLALSGSHFVADAPIWFPEALLTYRRLLQGNVESADSQVLVAQAPPASLSVWRSYNGWQTWTVSSAGIFFADGDVIYRAPFAE